MVILSYALPGIQAVSTTQGPNLWTAANEVVSATSSLSCYPMVAAPQPHASRQLSRAKIDVGMLTGASAKPVK